MFQCTECYLTKTELGIRFQQPSLIKTLYFLILTIYLSNLDQVLLPTQQKYPLYITIKLKHIFKTLPVNFMNNFHVGNACCPDLITKPLSRMQSLSESCRGSKVTKPIFSNSAKRSSGLTLCVMMLCHVVLSQKQDSISPARIIMFHSHSDLAVIHHLNYSRLAPVRSCTCSIDSEEH